MGALTSGLVPAATVCEVGMPLVDKQSRDTDIRGGGFLIAVIVLAVIYFLGVFLMAR